MQITTIGIDLAKTVFQLHAVDADGATVIRKRLRRAEVLSFVGSRTVPDRDGSLRDVALLGARTRKVRAHRKADASGLREALCQAWGERRHGCGGDLRGGDPAEHAVCAGQTGFRPMRCSSVAKTSMGLPGCFASSLSASRFGRRFAKKGDWFDRRAFIVSLL